MVATVDISIQAANPSMPLFPMRAFEGSPSSIRIRNVPKRIGDWVIDKVYFAVTYPDNTTQSIECKLVGGVYVGTIAGCATIGDVKNGYSIFADGKDENGNAVTDYCLGKGDVQILDASGITQPLQSATFVQILSARPDSPNDGDMWQDDGLWYIWQDGQAWAIGDESGAIGELTERVDDLEEDKQDKLTEPEMHAIDDYADVLATEIQFTDNSTVKFNWRNSEVTLQDFIDAGLVDENGTWIKQPRRIVVGKDVNSFYADAFLNCNELTSVIFNDKIAVGYGINPNYPWGIVDTSIIQPAYNATRYWVQQQNYASTYPYANAFISPMGVRKSTLQPYKVNQLTIASQAASFRVDVAGQTGNMRDLYFALTVPTDTQPITWNTYFDKFEGGNADAIAPKSGVNIYHIYEYASGHFAVERFDNAQSKLSDAQMAIINNATEEAKTVVTYRDGTISKFDIAGVIEDSRVIPNLAEVVEIKFGNTVTQLMKEQYGSEDDKYTFSECPYLSSVTIPDSVKLIGEMAFYNCANLTSVTFGNGVTSIWWESFYGCSGLTSIAIPNSVTSIGDYAFQNCAGLTSMTIPTSVTNIGNSAFEGCTSLTHVVTREASTRGFYGCTSLQSVEIYGSVVGNSAFYGCTSLKDVTMYDSVDIIVESAFEGCTALVNVQFSDRLNVIRSKAFKGCTSLVRINLPDSLTSIEHNAFEDCTSLHVLDIGNSLQTIGAEAFKNCLALNELQYVYLPKSIATIGANAFATNSASTTLVFIDQNEATIPLAPNYPWGIQMTSRIMTFRDASQEWVKEQAYGQQYGFKVGSITPRGNRPMNLTPYKVTTFTVASATNPFTITPTGDAGNMREYYLSLTLDVATSVMWASSIDVFKGGDASALAPVIGVNIYHILEYISGHFMVEKMV